MKTVVENGKLILSNLENAAGWVALKGLYEVNVPRIYFYWPRAAETEVVLDNPATADSMCAGLMVRFGDLGGRAPQQSDARSLDRMVRNAC